MEICGTVPLTLVFLDSTCVCVCVCVCQCVGRYMYVQEGGFVRVQLAKDLYHAWALYMIEQ